MFITGSKWKKDKDVTIKMENLYRVKIFFPPKPVDAENTVAHRDKLSLSNISHVLFSSSITTKWSEADDFI